MTARFSSLHDDAQHVEQLLRLRHREHRRRFVEDEHVRVADQALDDLDPLALAGREVVDARVRDRRRARSARRSRAPVASCRERRPLPFSPSVTFSQTVSGPMRLKCWCTIARPSRAASVGSWITTGRPSIRISPASGVTSPSSTFMSVVLPAPFWPSTPWISPRHRREVDVVARRDGAEPLRDRSDLDRRVHHGVTASRRYGFGT